MWKDDDDKIIDILDAIDGKDKKSLPLSCPICGKDEGHLYFHRFKIGYDKGGMWTWCSACHHCSHATVKVPRWWKNSEKIKFEKLASHPDYLEENKIYIDEWVNRLMFSNLENQK
ncbi:MAG: hypothetical protein K2J90_00615 [Lachnospiraceae bacterium]|nr:hypothetical protein [Lachnospiraceae bacterium]